MLAGELLEHVERVRHGLDDVVGLFAAHAGLPGRRKRRFSYPATRRHVNSADGLARGERGPLLMTACPIRRRRTAMATNSSTVQITTPDGAMSGFLARPSGEG